MEARSKITRPNSDATGRPTKLLRLIHPKFVWLFVVLVFVGQIPDFRDSRVFAILYGVTVFGAIGFAFWATPRMNRDPGTR